MYLILYILPLIYSKYVIVEIIGYRIGISIGNQNKSISFFPDLHSEYTFFISTYKTFIFPSNKTQKLIPFNIRQEEYQCYTNQESLKVKHHNFTIKNFTYCFNNVGINDLPRLAFGLQVEPQSSIVHHLFKQGLIDKIAFTFDMTKRDGFLYLGSLPKKFDKYTKGFCNVNKDNIGWTCYLTSIKFLNYTFPIRQYAYFDTYWISLYVPKKFKEKFTNEVIVNDANKKNNELRLGFQFGDYTFYIKNLISKSPNKKYVIGDKVMTKSTYILGQHFFTTFVLFFDYKNEQIVIYGNEGIERREKFYLNRKIILILNILIQFISIIFLILFKI